jgi:3-oxoacyl-[acyl-carrier protein] reductase
VRNRLYHTSAVVLIESARLKEQLMSLDEAPHALSGRVVVSASNRELAARVALVTGVSRRAGIGAAIARELGRAGARLFLTFYRSYDQQQTWGAVPGEPESIAADLRATGVDVEAMELDLRTPAAPAELFRRARQRFGHIDILVNNAAHWEAATLDAVHAAQLDRHYAVNVRAPVLLCAEFARQAASHRYGRIIQLTSGQGHSPMPGAIAYVATKAALDAVTLTLSAELAAAGITVNAIDPGPTDTGWISEAQRAEILQGSPGRISSAVDIARLVRRLAADDGALVTGRVIRAQVDGTALFDPPSGS